MKRVTEEEDTDGEDYVYAVGEKKQPMCGLEIDGEYVELMLDSGASVNLVDEVLSKNLQRQNKNPLASQTANFLLRIIHTPTPARNHLRQGNRKIQHHISDPARS